MHLSAAPNNGHQNEDACHNREDFFIIFYASFSRFPLYLSLVWSPVCFFFKALASTHDMCALLASTTHGSEPSGRECTTPRYDHIMLLLY